MKIEGSFVKMEVRVCMYDCMYVIFSVVVATHT